MDKVKLSRRDLLRACTVGAGWLLSTGLPGLCGADVTELDLYGQCHIDLLWQWVWQETLEITQSTFRNMLSLIEEVPQFAYYQNQAALYAAMEEYDPQLFEEIRAAVRAGSWHLVGGNWAEADAEADQGLCAGESVVRNYLLGKRYFRERFGVDVKIAWQMEGSAYLETLPQVLRGCGFEGAVLGRHERWEEWWRPVLRWRGADGSELPVGALRELSLSLKAHQIRTLRLELGYGGDRQEN